MAGRSRSAPPGCRFGRFATLLVPELQLRELADGRTGEGRADLDRLGHLVAPELVLEKALQLLGRERLRAGPQLHERFCALAAIGIRHADDQAFLDRGMLVDRLLD